MIDPVPVAGPRAFQQCLAALTLGRHVLVPGDDLTLAQEIMLKDEAARLGLMLLGPGCDPVPETGRDGRVGVVGVSPQATRRVREHLATAGEPGPVLTVGRRDLTSSVSGRSTLQALAAFDTDPAIQLIVIAADPPPAEVASLIREAARRLSTPVVEGPALDDALKVL
jgi:FdrA protein